VQTIEKIVELIHSLLEQLISIWSRAIEDPDAGVRISTLIVTMMGFFLLALILFFSMHVIGASMDVVDKPTDLIIGLYLGVLVLILLLGVVSIMPLLRRAGQYVSAEQLQTGMQQVLSARGGEDV